MGKLQGEKNEKVCEHLFTETEFFDWVVTTAFYAALHYTQHEIFPYKESLVTHSTFDSYYGSLKKNNGKPTKHDAQIALTSRAIPGAGAHYRFLHDNSWTARYRSYKVPKSVAETARKRLQFLKGFCTKE